MKRLRTYLVDVKQTISNLFRPRTKALLNRLYGASVGFYFEQIEEILAQDVDLRNCVIDLLSIPIRARRLDILEKLLEVGASPNGSTESRRPPLIEALGTQKTNYEMVKTLLKAGADPNKALISMPDEYSDVLPLPHAVSSSFAGDYQVSICRALIEAGANVNVQSKNFSPLHCTSCPQIAQLLIQSGADVNAYVDQSDGKKFYPLDAAILHRRAEVCRTLLAYGADLHQSLHPHTPTLEELATDPDIGHIFRPFLLRPKLMAISEAWQIGADSTPRRPAM